MKRTATKKTSRKPSAASLREIPEIDFDRYRVVGRGRHARRVGSSVEMVLFDRKVVDALGGPDALREIVEAVARGVKSGRRKRPAA